MEEGSGRWRRERVEGGEGGTGEMKRRDKEEEGGKGKKEERNGREGGGGGKGRLIWTAGWPNLIKQIARVLLSLNFVT